MYPTNGLRHKTFNAVKLFRKSHTLWPLTYMATNLIDNYEIVKANLNNRTQK